MADLTDFPLMVKITDGANDVFANAQADGDDILFTAADGSTKLPHEIEDFTTTSGSEQLIAWVKVPTLHASEDTVIFMYYGHSTIASQQDAAQVWDGNYVGVWHLKEDVDDEGSVADAYADSTANSNDGDQEGPVEGTGQIANGQDFDGDDDRITVASNPWSGLANGSLSFWTKFDAKGDQEYLFAASDHTGGKLFIRTYLPDADLGFFYSVHNTDHGGQGTPLDLAIDTWYHFVLIWDGVAPKFYKNGALWDTSTAYAGGSGPGAADDWIGDGWDGDKHDGIIDEVRVSNVARSAAWIAASYNNQNSPSTYQTETGSTTGGQTAGGTSATTLRNAVIRNAVIR